jgi:zinc transporter ZupT
VEATAPTTRQCGAALGVAAAEDFRLAFLLAIAVALLFLIIEELLREAHRVKETPWTTTTLFAGLLGFLLLHMLL